jgi:hypothetical protein
MIGRVRERGGGIRDGYVRDERTVRRPVFEMASGEQPVVSRVDCGDGKPWIQELIEEEPPRYKKEERRRLGESRALVRDELPDEYSYGSSDEEEGQEYRRQRYPSYPEYIAPLGQVHLSDTVFKLSATTTRTTKIFGIPVVKKTVEATDSQDWTGR